MRARRSILPAASSLLALFPSACGGDEPAAPPVATDRVQAVNNRFEPEAVVVAPGTTVTWTFAGGSVAHNVEGDGFKSKTVAKGEFAHRFARPGTYDYVCTLHTGMTGVVVVE